MFKKKKTRKKRKRDLCYEIVEVRYPARWSLLPGGSDILASPATLTLQVISSGYCCSSGKRKKNKRLLILTIAKCPLGVVARHELVCPQKISARVLRTRCFPRKLCVPL